MPPSKNLQAYGGSTAEVRDSGYILALFTIVPGWCAPHSRREGPQSGPSWRTQRMSAIRPDYRPI